MHRTRTCTLNVACPPTHPLPEHVHSELHAHVPQAEKFMTARCANSLAWICVGTSDSTCAWWKTSSDCGIGSCKAGLALAKRDWLEISRQDWQRDRITRGERPSGPLRTNEIFMRSCFPIVALVRRDWLLRSGASGGVSPCSTLTGFDFQEVVVICCRALGQGHRHGAMACNFTQQAQADCIGGVLRPLSTMWRRCRIIVGWSYGSQLLRMRQPSTACKGDGEGQWSSLTYESKLLQTKPLSTA